MKRLVLAALFALSLHAETVYLTAHGKTYHTNPKCMALSRAAHVLETDDQTAVAHGLHQCGICAHRKSKGTTAKPDNAAFAKETTK